MVLDMRQIARRDLTPEVIQIAPAEERAPATPRGTVVPIVQPATDPLTAPAAPTPAPKVSTPLPTERALPTEIPAQVPSSFRPGSNRIPPPSIPPQN